MLGIERERFLDVGFEHGGGLARDAVEEIEGDVLETAISQNVHRPADVLGVAAPLQHVQEGRVERLCAERHAIDTVSLEKRRQVGRDRLGVRLDGDLVRAGQRSQKPLQRVRRRERRRAAAQEDRLEPRREHLALQLELREKRGDVPAVLLPAPDHRHEIAVAAAVHAERHVHVEVTNAAHFDRSPFRSSTARNASCGTSTIPTCFMRFLPFFWRSISFRLRVMSPP